MDEASQISHWRFPGWRSIVLASAVGLVTPFLALLTNRLIRVGHLPPEPSRGFLLFALAVLPLFVFFEEWLFRGQLLRGLAGYIPNTAALVISSALFAAVHCSLSGLPGRFVAGIVLGTLYLRTRSLWPPMATHLIHNLVLFGTIFLDVKWDI